jgi:hypothetical protein
MVVVQAQNECFSGKKGWKALWMVYREYCLAILCGRAENFYRNSKGQKLIFSTKTLFLQSN